jgi:hypothetical protein
MRRGQLNKKKIQYWGTGDPQTESWDRDNILEKHKKKPDLTKVKMPKLATGDLDRETKISP